MFFENLNLPLSSWIAKINIPTMGLFFFPDFSSGLNGAQNVIILINWKMVKKIQNHEFFILKKKLWKKITKLLIFYKRNFVHTQHGAIYPSQQRQQKMQRSQINCLPNVDKSHKHGVKNGRILSHNSGRSYKLCGWQSSDLHQTWDLLKRDKQMKSKNLCVKIILKNKALFVEADTRVNQM